MTLKMNGLSCNVSAYSRIVELFRYVGSVACCTATRKAGYLHGRRCSSADKAELYSSPAN